MTATQKRIYDLTHMPRNGWDIAGEIAAELEAKDAEIARLKPYAEAALHTLNCERMMTPAWMIDNREEADKLAAVDFELWQELRRRYAREFGG